MGLKRRVLMLVIVVACVRYCVHCQSPFFPSSQQDLLRRNQLITSLPGSGISTRKSVSMLPGTVGYGSFPSRYSSPFSQVFGSGLSSPSTLGLLDRNDFNTGGGTGATGRIEPFSDLGVSRESTYPSLARNHPFSSIRLNPVPTSKGVSLTRPQEDRFDRNRDRFTSLFDSDKARKYSLDAPSTFEKPITKTSLPDVNSPITLDLATDEQERVAYAKRKGQLPPSRRLSAGGEGEEERPRLHSVFDRGNRLSPSAGFSKDLLGWERPSSLPPMPGHSTPTTTHFDGDGRQPEQGATRYPAPAKNPAEDNQEPYFDDTAPFLEPPPKGTQAGVPIEPGNEPEKGKEGTAGVGGSQSDGSSKPESRQSGRGPTLSIVSSEDGRPDEEFVPTAFLGRERAEDKDRGTADSGSEFLPYNSPVHYTDSPLDADYSPKLPPGADSVPSDSKYGDDKSVKDAGDTPKSSTGSASSADQASTDPEEKVVANVDKMVDALKAKAVGGAGGGADPLGFPPPLDPLADLPSAPLPTIPVDSSDVLQHLEIARAATEADAGVDAQPVGGGTAFEGPGRDVGLGDVLKEARDVTGFGLDTSIPGPPVEDDGSTDVISNGNVRKAVRTHTNNDLPGDLEPLSVSPASPDSSENQGLGRFQEFPVTRNEGAGSPDQGESYQPVSSENGAPGEESAGVSRGELHTDSVRPANTVSGYRPEDTRSTPPAHTSDSPRGHSLSPSALRPVNSRTRTTGDSDLAGREYPNIPIAGLRPVNFRPPVNSRSGAVSRELPTTPGSEGSPYAGRSGPEIRSERAVDDEDLDWEYDEGDEEDEEDEGDVDEELFSLHERGENVDEDSVPPDRQHTPFENSHTDGDYATPSALGNLLDPSNTPSAPQDEDYVSPTEYTSPSAYTSPGDVTPSEDYTPAEDLPSTTDYTSPGFAEAPSPTSFPDDYLYTDPYESAATSASPREYTSAGVATSPPNAATPPERMPSLKEEMPSPQNETENATLSEEDREEDRRPALTEGAQQPSQPLPAVVDEPSNVVPIPDDPVPVANDTRPQQLAPPPPVQTNPEKQPSKAETTTAGGRKPAEKVPPQRDDKGQEKDILQPPSDLVSFEKVTTPKPLPPIPQPAIPQPAIPTTIGRRRNPIIAENIGGSQIPGRGKVSPFEMMFGKSLNDAYQETFGSLFGNLNSRAPSQPGALFSGGGSGGNPSFYAGQGGAFGAAAGTGGVFNDRDRERGFTSNDRAFGAGSDSRGFGTTTPDRNFVAGAGGYGANSGGFGASGGGFGSNVFGGRQLFDPNLNGIVNQRPSLRLFGGGK